MPPFTAPDGALSVTSSVSTALKQPASMFLFLHIESLGEVLWGMLLPRLVKRVKTATAKWIRVDISPCQL